LFLLGSGKFVNRAPDASSAHLAELLKLRDGVSVQSITSDIAAALSLPATHGALVGEVERDSAAERAGIKAGDAILRSTAKRCAMHPSCARGSACARVAAR
jgi:hypothetical protein